jgi:PleD family two-component response regulator
MIIMGRFAGDDCLRAVSIAIKGQIKGPTDLVARDHAW